ncbi:MFS transporter [Nocardia africana]|uniref:MFS transporter n=1 Tax=Nocardia africana TaxID=134964 RepID=UPI001D14853C|nr:MFS transporter [Nocardia africana]MCC3314459.1 MFS transporter [Nocardia africana]
MPAHRRLGEVQGARGPVETAAGSHGDEAAQRDDVQSGGHANQSTDDENASVPTPRRARAFGVWSGVYGLSMAIGPILGGVLVGSVGWRSVFWINLPIGVAAIALCALFVPESAATRPRRADPVGQVLVVVVLASATYAIIEGRAIGGAAVAVVMAVAAGAAVALVRYELGHPEPLIDPRLFARRGFAGGVVMALIGMAAAGGYLWVTTFYLQDARGLSAAAAGIFLLPVAMTVLLVAPISGRLTATYGPRIPLLLSGFGIAAAALLLTGLTPATSGWSVVSSFVLFGVGFGMLNAPITATTVAGMSPEQAGVASAAASTGRQVGQALGVAVVGAVVVPGIGTHPAQTLAVASHPGWWIIVGAGLSVALSAALTAPLRKPERAADVPSPTPISAGDGLAG